MGNSPQRRLKLFHHQNGLCGFCDRPVDLASSNRKHKPDNAACLYHLDMKLDIDRGHWPPGSVLVCRMCADDAARTRTAAIPIEVLHALASQHESGKLRRKRRRDGNAPVAQSGRAADF